MNASLTYLIVGSRTSQTVKTSLSLSQS